MTTMTPEQVVEAQAQLGAVDTRIAEVYAGIQQGAMDGADISELTLEYSALISERGGLRTSVNSRLIDDEKSAVFQAIGQLIASSRLPELLGEPVTILVWQIRPGSGGNGPIQSCEVNQDITVAGAKRKSSGGSTAGKGSSKVQYTDGMTVYTARETVLKFGSKETLDLALVANGEGKWVTKPAHVDAALVNAEANGFHLTQVTA